MNRHTHFRSLLNLTVEPKPFCSTNGRPLVMPLIGKVVEMNRQERNRP